MCYVASNAAEMLIRTAESPLKTYKWIENVDGGLFPPIRGVFLFGEGRKVARPNSFRYVPNVVATSDLQGFSTFSSLETLALYGKGLHSYHNLYALRRDWPEAFDKYDANWCRAKSEIWEAEIPIGAQYRRNEKAYISDKLVLLRPIHHREALRLAGKHKVREELE